MNAARATSRVAPTPKVPAPHEIAASDVGHE